MGLSRVHTSAKALKFNLPHFAHTYTTPLNIIFFHQDSIIIPRKINENVKSRNVK